MPASALKKKPRIVEAAPQVPDDRLGLFDALQARERAVAAVEKQLAAIDKARSQIADADGEDGEIEKLRKAIPLAVEADEKRAASVLKNPKGTVAVGWSADHARSALKVAEERLAMTERARERLQGELRDLEDDVAAADNAVTCAIKQLTVPSIDRLLTDLAADRKRLAIKMGIIAMLVSSAERGPTFHNALRSMKAGSARDAVVAEVKKRFETLQFTAAAAEHYDTVQTAIAAWTAALAALRGNAAAELPKL